MSGPRDSPTEVEMASNDWLANPDGARSSTGARDGEPAPLEAGLRPDTVRHHPSGERHTAVIDAGFAAATVRVVRTEHPGADTTYQFLKSDHTYGQSRWTELPGDGAFDLGVVAAGDHWPKPGVEHGNMYAELGEQTREHLLGMIDAVATKGTAPPRERQPSWRAQWPAITPDHINRGRSL